MLADLHIHSILSPCGDLDMSPSRIIDEAAIKGLDVIAITDHNTTLHCRLAYELGQRKNILVIPGTEVCSKEEIHCLCYFSDFDALDKFEAIIHKALPPISNIPEKFGYQVVVDENEHILQTIDSFLLSATSLSINQIETLVHELGGIFIPAHIDRPSYSVLSQLGFFPQKLNADAIECQNPFGILDIPAHIPIICSSDSHYLHQIGKRHTRFDLDSIDVHGIFELIKQKQLHKIHPVA